MSWEDIIKVIQIPNVNLNVKDLSNNTNEKDEDCKSKFWDLWRKLESRLSFTDPSPYKLLQFGDVYFNSLTNKDYCDIIEYLKGLNKETFDRSRKPTNRENIGDNLYAWIGHHPTYGRFALEIYHKRPHPVIEIYIYDYEEFIKAIRRHS
tara:strand:+ start:409 stop:858 length:450 start_codon:yes stop_codon:yes gene_type:complete